ncbi:hypothetical protein BKG68_10280 [Mycobacteroides saopaulense]|uniref:Uncharacterized protein n=2 Tax=Mycobacteroides saopaulense TaxID=1578165 RepID=A0ABX3BXB8_9MYCO|nr:hypothetical protein BKG68_10280 [Mycobacteroides saopaulense]OHU08394.1 hypothetical protein BKG73_14970 [Mycobacteroides saopaulense]
MAGYLAPMFAPSVGLIRELRYVVRTDGVIVVDVPLLGEPENVNHRSGERVDEISVGYLIVHIAEQRDVYLYDVLPSY